MPEEFSSKDFMCGTLSWTLAVVNGGNVGENRAARLILFHSSCNVAKIADLILMYIAFYHIMTYSSLFYACSIQFLFEILF